MSTGLFYYGYRYYDSQSGKFTSLDRHPPDCLNPQSLNRYAYTLNNPNRYVDSDGWFAQQTDVTPHERAAIRAAVKDLVARQGRFYGRNRPRHILARPIPRNRTDGKNHSNETERDGEFDDDSYEYQHFRPDDVDVQR